MTSSIHNRVNNLRQWLDSNNYDALIVPHEDEYLSEYTAPHNERLAWITGFTGSAGASIITKTNAVLFVDGRYTVQVAKQSPSDLFDFHHLIQEPPVSWLAQHFTSKVRVALDPKMHSTDWLQKAIKSLPPHIELCFLNDNPIDVLWDDRPIPAPSIITLMDEQFSGVSSFSKRTSIAKQLSNQSADSALLTQADSICWLLNIRGSDVPRLPVILSYALINADTSVDLFLDAELPAEFDAHVGDHVRVHPTNEMTVVLSELANKRVILDPFSCNAWFNNLLTDVSATVIYDNDPCVLKKACKNATEALGMKNCHVRDGVAMVKFLSWVDAQVANGTYLNEAELSDQLQLFREQDPSLLDLSFNTISAAGSNAAMCHYNHEGQKEYGKLTPNSLYLVDSGGQYPDGTTDITRTIAIGSPSDFMKQQFTLVLKGHIALANARFPEGTTGSQLDILARQFLWSNGYNYDHGTGHGVGHCLSVHEGPHRISPAYNAIALQAGMVVSNEPGYYRDNEFGIRIENLEIVDQFETNGDLTVLGLKSLTRCPIDIRAIQFSLLTEIEIQWLNAYHKLVWDDVSPLVDGEVKDWLLNATKAI